jgi:prolyl oligopeptidase
MATPRAAFLVLLAACGSTTHAHDPAFEVGQRHDAVARAEVPRPPIAKPRPHQDTYHGVAVSDPYRWLEDTTPEVNAWVTGQTAFAQRYLTKLDELSAFRTEIAAIVNAPQVQYGALAVAGTTTFALRRDPAKQQRELVAIANPLDPQGSIRLVLDPTTSDHPHRAIDWYRASPDGKLIAVSLSDDGSEAGDVHVIDLDGKELEVVPDVQRAGGGGSLAWAADGKGFYYTRYPSGDEKPAAEHAFWQQVWFHALGTPITADRYEVGKDFPRIAEISLAADARGRVLATVQHGDSGIFQHHLRDARGTWRRITDWTDAVPFVGFGPTEDLWLISRKSAPRGKVQRLAATAPLARAVTVVGEDDADAIVTSFYEEQGLTFAGNQLYLTVQTGGPVEIRAYTLGGAAASAPKLPPVAGASVPIAYRDGILVHAWSYTTPRTLLRFTPRPRNKEPAQLALPHLSPPPPVDLSRFEVYRAQASSRDNTKVPLTIVWPRGARRDGSTPCIVTGYGGFGISSEPHFLASLAPLLARGFCYVDTNLRGGGEHGESWHIAGTRTQKQNVFDDFDAVLGFLVEHRYTSRARLGIMGGSNGGLLMGAELTQHPSCCKAVVATAGLYDVLRFEQSPNGQYTVPEFGTVTDRALFKAMYAYSPYHRVLPSVRYPATLMLLGSGDARVSPWQSYKMVAALQAAQVGDAPILLRVADRAGHVGSSASETIERTALISAFLRAQLR